MMKDRPRWLVIAAFVAMAAGCKAQARLAWRPPPPPDTDRDGIVDPHDRCAGPLEDKLPPVVDDGCPHPDPDADGMVAPADQCPFHSETINGFSDSDGCPDVSPPPPKPVPLVFKGVRLTDTKVEIDEKIQFETDSADISPASDELIKNIAGILQAHPDVDFVEVAGHADARGGNTRNKKLTQKRAESVMARLVLEGLSATRLRAVGYGPFCPLDPAFTDDAHAKNRRVEFIILRRAGRDAPDKWGGCRGAEARGMTAAPIPDSAPKSTK